MLQKRKKGFTIVELVVVIAVVAVLAAVLIPTFANIVKKAKISNDTVLVKNLNTALVTSAAIDGTPKTMHEALARVAESGYSVEKLTPRSTGDILWDQTTNRFVLKDGENVVFAEDTGKTYQNHALWKIVKAETEIETSNAYSYYLADGFTSDGVLDVTTGIDTGSNTGLTITLTSSETVTLITRTNAGNSLTVNAPSANVSHHGELNNLNITAVADASYHEYGVISGNVTITRGRFVAEAGSSVTVLMPQNRDVKIDVAETAHIGAIVAENTILENNSNIKAENVSKVTVDSEKYQEMQKFAGGLGTANNPYLIQNAQQFKNIDTLSSTMADNFYYFSLIDDIDLRTVEFENNYAVEDFSGVFDGRNHKIYTNDSLTYLFKWYRTTEFKNTELVLDEKTVTLTSVNGALLSEYVVYDNIDYSAVDDRNIYAINHNSSLYKAYNLVYTSKDGGSHYSWKGVFRVLNCDVHLNLKNSTDVNANASAAVFFGAYIYDKGVGSIVEVSNCSYEGVFRGPYVALVLNNGQTNEVGPQKILKVSNITNNGTLIGIYDAHLVAGQIHNANGNTAASQYYDSFKATPESRGSINVSNVVGMDVGVSEEGTIFITRETNKTATKYVIKLYGTMKVFDTNGVNFSSSYNYNVKFDIDVTDTDTIQTQIKEGKILDKATAVEKYKLDLTGVAWEKHTDEEVMWTTVIKDGQTYYVFDFEKLSATTNYTYTMEVANPVVVVDAYDGETQIGSITKQ